MKLHCCSFQPASSACERILWPDGIEPRACSESVQGCYLLMQTVVLLIGNRAYVEHIFRSALPA
jgi:hypothetical protein